MLMKNLFDWISIISEYNKEYGNTPRFIIKIMGQRKLYNSYIRILGDINRMEYLDTEYIKDVANSLTYLNIYTLSEEEPHNNESTMIESKDMAMMIKGESIELRLWMIINQKINFTIGNESVGESGRAKIKEISIRTYNDYNRMSINIFDNNTGVLTATEKDRLDKETCRALKIQDINEEFKKFLIEQIDEYYIKFKKLL